jgi:hypothetical protein
MNEFPRQELADRQLRLVNSLQGHAPAPEGFDAGRLTAAGRALFQKRMRAVAKFWPGLAALPRVNFAEAFAQYAGQHLLPAGGATEDGLAFARDLAARKLLPRKLRWQLFLYRWRKPKALLPALFLLPAVVFCAGCSVEHNPAIARPESAVVRIISLGEDPGHVIEGRGFFITSDGLIVTRLHLINPAGEILVTPSGGHEVKGRFVQEDKASDLALIRIPGHNYPFLRLFDDEIVPGMHVRVLGSEGINHGVFDHWENTGQTMAFTAHIGLNDAGAPLLADDGRVVGVVRGLSQSQAAPNDAAPIWHVFQMMPELARPGLEKEYPRNP